MTSSLLASGNHRSNFHPQSANLSLLSDAYPEGFGEPRPGAGLHRKKAGPCHVGLHPRSGGIGGLQR